MHEMQDHFRKWKVFRFYTNESTALFLSIAAISFFQQHRNGSANKWLNFVFLLFSFFLLLPPTPGAKPTAVRREPPVRSEIRK